MWIGAYGYNLEGIRIGQDKSRRRRAAKVGDRREFRNLGDLDGIGSLQYQELALRHLRRFA